MGKLFYPGWFAHVRHFACFLRNGAGVLPGTYYTQKNKEKNKTAAYMHG